MLGGAGADTLLAAVDRDVMLFGYDGDDRYVEGNREAWRALVEAYSPVGHGKILNNGDLAAMAEKHGVSVPQLCIRTCLQLDLLPLPKTANPGHMRSNAAVDFVISDADMETLKGAERIKDDGDASAFPVYAVKR